MTLIFATQSGAAIAGDDIVLQPGLFSGYFYATNDGTASQPITIRSADINNKAIVRGYSLLSLSASPLYVSGNYWHLQDLEVTNGGKAIVFDNAIGGKILNCKIHTTGKNKWHGSCLQRGNPAPHFSHPRTDSSSC